MNLKMTEKMTILIPKEIVVYRFAVPNIVHPEAVRKQMAANTMTGDIFVKLHLCVHIL